MLLSVVVSGRHVSGSGGGGSRRQRMDDDQSKGRGGPRRDHGIVGPQGVACPPPVVSTGHAVLGRTLHMAVANRIAATVLVFG